MGKQLNLKYLLFVLGLFVIFLIINYVFGTKKILEAHKNKFNGGICYACQICTDCSTICKDFPACQKKSGFDLWYLCLSLFFFNLIVGMFYTIRDKKLSSSVVGSFLTTIGFMITTEIMIRVLKIPVLRTHFMEARQGLYYQAFLWKWYYNKNVHIFYLIFSNNIHLLFLIFASLISSLIGNIIAYPVLVILKKHKVRREINTIKP